MRIITKTPVTLLVLLVVALAASSCTSGEAEVHAEGVSVVVSTTMLGDIARNVVGDDGFVEVLFPIGASAHTFQPSSSQVAAIYAADLVVVNGLGLEEGLLDVIKAAQADGVNVVEVAELLNPVMSDSREPCPAGHVEDDHEEDGHEEDGHEEGHGHGGGCDPHVWFDPGRGAEMATIVARSLSTIDSSVAWDERAAAYGVELADADARIVELLDSVPAADRMLVTNHDSLGYFADRYGFVVVGTVFPGRSELSEPSSAALAGLVKVINETGVSAIFTETSESDALAIAIADEVDHDVVVISLYTGSLGEVGSGAETLIDMLETNAARVAAGLS